MSTKQELQNQLTKNDEFVKRFIADRETAERALESKIDRLEDTICEREEEITFLNDTIKRLTSYTGAFH